ncbi:unnamed protein product [Oppiella nova]|uniref:TIL domain-containing protein n=1 Tax=Oppiella nova TaxID=334625 RepID=A0A7R9M6R3_9ACAR|nr:unnamed protein product [Oppiella nova]CAG2171827.1 unnamed protein product [Oppiella nova]
MRSFVLIIFIAVILTGITSAQRCINGRHIQCGSACPITCNNLRSPPRFCTKNCVSGCQCDRGLGLSDEKQKVKLLEFEKV